MTNTIGVRQPDQAPAEDAVERFTPGPWSASGAGIFGPAGKLLAATGDDSFSSLMEAEQVANATLISSAPDMYAALESLLVELRNVRGIFASNGQHAEALVLNVSVERIKRALRKARGQQ